jgi:hypothetical protein
MFQVFVVFLYNFIKRLNSAICKLFNANFFMCLFQLYVASFRLEIFFSNEPAGASFGRSATSRKNSFQNFEAFHFYLGQKLVR